MTKIVPNDLLQPTEKCIKNWNCTFIATEGPNVTAKLSLEDLAITYDAQYRGRMVLKSGLMDQPLICGFVGQTSTFLMIKVTYDTVNDPYYRYEKDSYNIEYYFEDDPLTIRPIGKLMILTGSSGSKLPQIYLNNNLDYDVVLDILQADIEVIEPVTINTGTTFSNLYWNNVVTDKNGCGSTQFKVLNSNSDPVAYIPFNSISSFIPEELNPKKILIYTTTKMYTLTFLSEFDKNQVYARMMFVWADIDHRYLDQDYVYTNCVQSGGTDTTPPVIHYNAPYTGITAPSTAYLHLIHDSITGWTLSQLNDYFVSGVTDIWDGNIPISAITLTLQKFGSIPELTEITEEGMYRLTLSVSDIAGNLTTNVISTIYVDDAPPVIAYYAGVLTAMTGNTTTYSGITGITSGITITSGFTLSLSGFSLSSITHADIILNIIDSVTDAVELSITKDSLSVLVANISGEVGNITVAGYYCVKFYVADKCGNSITQYLLFIVI